MCYNKAENAGIIVARKRQVSESKYQQAHVGW